MIERQPNTQYVASISRGKDSNAMLHVIKDVLHYPLDRIVTVQVWATQDIPAELPPMVAWQDECDKRILDMFGVPVERLCAKDKNGNKVSYNDIFYRKITPRGGRAREAGTEAGLYKPRGIATIYGYPQQRGSWCKKLKTEYVPNITDSPTLSWENRGDSDGVTGSSSRIYGYPIRGGNWCQSLKRAALNLRFLNATSGVVQQQAQSRSETPSFLISPANRGLK